MSKAKYTPGPWEVVGGNVYTKLGAENRAGVKAHETDGWCIAATNSCPCISSEGVDEDLPMVEFMANARLIAAAPDMLEALEFAREWINFSKGYVGGGVKILEEIDAAIAKTKGES